MAAVTGDVQEQSDKKWRITLLTNGKNYGILIDLDGI
jgi:hypothetical protein